LHGLLFCQAEFDPDQGQKLGELVMEIHRQALALTLFHDRQFRAQGSQPPPHFRQFLSPFSHLRLQRVL
jgi:hypothetical protein